MKKKHIFNTDVGHFFLVQHGIVVINFILHRINNIHTENQQKVIFQESEEHRALEKNNDTTLTDFFKLNESDPEARNIKYINIPQFYTFDRQKKIWKKKWEKKKKRENG